MLPFLEGNQFASALIVTTLFAAFLAYARNLPLRAWKYLWSAFSVTVEVKDSDQAFNWLSLWLHNHEYSKKARQLTVHTYSSPEDDDEYVYEYTGRKRTRPKLLFTPSAGQHFLWYKNKMLWLTRESKEAPANPFSPGAVSSNRESFHISVFGRSQDTIRALLEDAMTMAMPDIQETRVVPSAGGRWSSAIRLTPRKANSVILADGVMEDLVADVNKFLTGRKGYNELGIPYRRGYLLHGKAGSGKTSAVLAVAGELNLDIYVINLGDKFIDDGQLNVLLSQIPAGNIVLLEDIDAAFHSRVEVTEEVESKQKKNRKQVPESTVTFSGLLNALDGVAAREGRILFMTTNHVDLLDEALIRPGRADVHIPFECAKRSQAERLFSRFFPDATADMVTRFGAALAVDATSMAALQDHLIRHRESALTAVLAFENDQTKLMPVTK